VIVLLGVLIFVHELGHFGAAKAVGIAVERFSIGFGPRVLGFTRRGTEYVVAAIPLGGYVKMQGMHDDMMDKLEGGDGQPREPRPDDFDAKPLWARAFVITAGVAMNMLFAAVLFVFVSAAWGVPDLATTRVMAVRQSLLPAGTEALAGVQPGARLARVGGVEPETWGDLRRFFQEAPSGAATVVTEGPNAEFRIVVPASNAERNAILADPSVPGRRDGALEPWLDPIVGQVAPASPAERASIEAGDRVTSVDGEPVRSWLDMTTAIRGRGGQRVEIRLSRGDDELVRLVDLASERDPETGETVGSLGIRSAGRVVSAPVGVERAVVLGAEKTVSVTRQIVAFVGALVTLQVSPRSLGSIGTIAVMSNDAARAGLPAYLEFMALFSVNLAVLNMLPIPVLDGGHMIFLAIEAVRGKKVTAQQRLRWSQVGLIVVVGIMAMALGNDLVRFLPF